jgi:hypothetical protein
MPHAVTGVRTADHTAMFALHFVVCVARTLLPPPPPRPRPVTEVRSSLGVWYRYRTDYLLLTGRED